MAASLAAMHAHYLGSGPLETATSIDADWWRAACGQRKLEQLAGLPRTLLHGDVHRNNVVVDGRAGRLVDWESGLHGIPQFNLITFGGLGSPDDGRAQRMVDDVGRVLGELERATWLRSNG